MECSANKPVKNALDDLSVVHRLCFATRSLPVGLPNYWEIVAKFGTVGRSNCSLSGQDARIFVENLKYLNPSVFESDFKLTKELVKTPKTDDCRERIGVALISPNDACIECGSKLYVRTDRSVQAVLYDSQYGSLPALHYSRYCRKKGCSFQQHYGYYTKGDSKEVRYNKDALQLPYFLCSRETAFSIEILKRFDMESLIGQVSYKQSAEIYNSYHEYECDEIEMEQKRYIILIII